MDKATRTVVPVVKLHKPRNTQPASKIPALVIDGCKTPKIKSESSSSSFTPESAADVRGLPAFIAPTWIGVFLPALYHFLTVSDDPMVLGSIGVDPKQPGKEIVAILQTLLAETYPGNGWTVTWGGCHLREGERRSAMARAGLRGADDIFKRVSYYEDFESGTPGALKTDQIKKDARYAVLEHGPAFYKRTIPQGVSMLDPEDPEYIKPRGYLESKIIIDTMTPFIKGEAFQLIIMEDENGKEVVDPSSILPIGALGMTAAAVERAYQAYRSGERVKPRDFSSQHFGTAVAGFITSIKGLSVSRWQSIINACGANVRGCAAVAKAAAEVENSLDGTSDESAYKLAILILRELGVRGVSAHRGVQLHVRALCGALNAYFSRKENGASHG
ncbi:hypothetical protein B0H14DRAFT_3488017 [Mycena olivaceomarginata]|nr:hypothetical protein B0H14DRAFT_3488017 [Mycena olivaceomarginata]